MTRRRSSEPVQMVGGVQLDLFDQETDLDTQTAQEETNPARKGAPNKSPAAKRPAKKTPSPKATPTVVRRSSRRPAGSGEDR